MSTKVKGRQLYVFAQDKPIAGSTGCEIELNAETIETASSGRWRTYRTRLLGWSVNCSGLYVLEPESPTNIIGGAKTIGQKVNVVVSVLSRSLVEAGVDIGSLTPNEEHALVGSAIITSCRYVGPSSGMATYAITFQGTGKVTPIAL